MLARNFIIAAYNHMIFKMEVYSIAFEKKKNTVSLFGVHTMIYPKLYLRACVGLAGALKCTENLHCIPLNLVFVLLFFFYGSDPSLYLSDRLFLFARKLLLSNSSHCLLSPFVSQSLVVILLLLSLEK